MGYEFQKQAISEVAQKLKKQGFRVFIAKSGTHGLYTDDKGEKLVSFQADLLAVTFSGKYWPNNMRSTGNGWRIADHDNGDYKGMFAAYPPQWAIGSASKWHFSTLAEHMKQYQNSSQYTEI